MPAPDHQRIPTGNTKLDTAISFLVIFAAWLGFRIYAYVGDWPHIMAILPEEGFDWVAFPPEYLRDNLLKAMYYFRQVPPLPQWILGLSIKVFGWPFTYPYIAFLLSLMSLASALFMRDLIRLSGIHRHIATTIAVLWCVSADNIAYEIDAYPKAMYELMTSCFFICSAWSLKKYTLSSHSKFFVLFAAMTVLLVMTRSTLSAFFIIPIALGLATRKKLPAALGFSALLFQLLLAGKNYAAYGNFHLETSSFAPANFMASLISSNHVNDFAAYATTNDKKHLCIQYLSATTIEDEYCRQVFETARQKDQAIAAKTGLPVDTFNYGSQTLYDVFQPVKRLYISFLIQRPDVLYDILASAYTLFWHSSLDGVTPVVGIMNDKTFSALQQLTNYCRYINIALMHLLCLPALAVLLLRIIWQRRLRAEDIPFLYTGLCFLYVALVSSIADYSENNRYRFAVESLIWVLPFMAWDCLARQYREARQMTS